jgi:hypothetical protein
MISPWWHELGSAALGLWRSPRYTVQALLSLALSIGAATAMFSVFSALISCDRCRSRGKRSSCAYS